MSDQPSLREIAEQLLDTYQTWDSEYAIRLVERAMRLAIEAACREFTDDDDGYPLGSSDFHRVAARMVELLKAAHNG